jgi:arginine decarboxylase
MKVLADEAHGTHFYFGSDMPVSAMSVGADMAGVSMHKSGGSLTQSSFLLLGQHMSAGYVRQIINLTQTTSGSYLLMSSLDVSRKNLAQNGKNLYKRVQELGDYAREEINGIGDYYAFGRELCDGDALFDFDPLKLSVNTLNIGLAGIEVYDLLRDEYNIQVEFGDVGNFLAYLSLGDRERDIERLVSALFEIRRRYKRERASLIPLEYMEPDVICTPQEAFYADTAVLPIEESCGHICAELVMCYPPGIPMLSPGERITHQILEYIRYMKEHGGTLTGPEDSRIEHLKVLKGR